MLNFRKERLLFVLVGKISVYTKLPCLQKTTEHHIEMNGTKFRDIYTIM